MCKGQMCLYTLQRLSGFPEGPGANPESWGSKQQGRLACGPVSANLCYGTCCLMHANSAHSSHNVIINMMLLAGYAPLSHPIGWPCSAAHAYTRCAAHLNCLLLLFCAACPPCKLSKALRMIDHLQAPVMQAHAGLC